MIEHRTEQQLIRKSHPMWKTIDRMCFNSKNLYNYANYIVRKEFTENGNYTLYKNLNKELKAHQQYKDCMSQPANCVLRLLDKNWKSFFNGMKEWKKNKSKFLGMPKPPKYLKPNGRFVWEIPNNTCYIQGNELKFHMKLLNIYRWKTKALGRLIQVRFVPRGTCYVMEVVTEISIPDYEKKQPTNIASIDLGINNFATITNNIGVKPIIINGKGIKSINQFYNKRRSKIVNELRQVNGVSWSNFLSDITVKRFNRIKNFMHHASKYVIEYCIRNDIDTVVCGLNKKWKNKQNIGHVNNQTMQSIPFNMFIMQMQYKCKEYGLNFITVEESYTSGTSFLDKEQPTKESYNKKRRIKRGLFQSEKGLLNSDVNGSLQIMKKVFPYAYKRSQNAGYGIEGCLTPSIINVVGI